IGDNSGWRVLSRVLFRSARHRDPPLAARHARRAGARLAAAGEWRLAAILTDLAWLLRAYSQSVSSDGAQHGEKTS
ncbi:hypothetical protein LJG04_31865, partial [Pseudomonas aeruginosa]|uniref:hypothetical protein n=1 Tax=Pseudomonas aeruginosa TaxID=287 RepID=UPI001D0A6B1A